MLSLVPVLLDWPLVLFPIHIVFLELIIDPACSIAFESEPEEDDVMLRAPRARGQSMLGGRRIGASLVQGVWASLLVLGVLGWGVARRLPEDESRALAFTTFVLLAVGLLFSSRSRRRSALASLAVKNGSLWLIAGGAVALLALVQVVPATREVFRFAPLDARELLLVLGVVAAGTLGFDVVKRARRLEPAPPRAA